MISPKNGNEGPPVWKQILREFKRKRRFEDDEMEQLFQRYVLQANKIHLTHLLGLLIATLTVMFLGLLLIFSLSPSSSKTEKEQILPDSLVTELAVFFSIVVFCISLAGVVFYKKTSEVFLVYISYALTATFIVLAMTLTRKAANMWATVFFLNIIFGLLPIRLLEATISGICLCMVHVPPFHKELTQRSYNEMSSTEKFVNLLLLSSVVVVGVLTHFPADLAKRKAFLEIRQCERVRITVQKETVRQQRLLMSVLPEHLIEEMKTDLAREGGSISKRKVYMKTYEPVSILFADIVGFTSLADRSPGSLVVQLLNELYCSFDRLARRNRCMRIKLLGDCYYCVCGLPKPSAIHASHCVNMGLDMIDAMQTIREKFNVDVDIRVGIHTGRLQCGVLGLKKWQFDIWSSDVELANNMESGGVPGKVHISESTKNHLKALANDYIIEPAFGSSRESSLKGTETYFVTQKGRLKQASTSPRTTSLTALPSSLDTTLDQNLPLFNPLKRERDIDRELIATLYNSINSRSILRLKKKFCKSTVLRFKENYMEKKYNQEPDRMLQSYFIAALVVYVAVSIVQILTMPSTLLLYICTAVGLVWVVFACSLVVAWKYQICKCFPFGLARFSRKITHSRNWSQALALCTVCICYVVIVIPMVSDESYQCRSRPDIEAAEARSLTPIGPIRVEGVTDTCVAKTLPYPEHTLLYTILIMIMTGAFQIIMFTYKFLIMLVLCIVYGVLLMTTPFFMKSVVAVETAIKYFLMIMALASYLLLILIQSQQSEIVHRLDFVWKVNARADTENAKQLQAFNQKLIENILPAHVARHYLERDRPSDELYHEECLSACILFACITNFSFSDVDGEHNITILHDIISDIDEMLNESVFSSVEKIKSTGAVYMAASGLSLLQENANNHNHVVAMAYFALRLRNLMQLINFRHSSSYGVKIGICMGPVVAGVIGASMPQYDIWGNTVNVASRMYSTGLEDHIQVTENVAQVASKNGFRVEKRGQVYVKGKGSMTTYFLKMGPSNEEETKPLEDQRPEPPLESPRSSQRRWSWSLRQTKPEVAQSSGNSLQSDKKTQSNSSKGLNTQERRGDGLKTPDSMRGYQASQNGQSSYPNNYQDLHSEESGSFRSSEVVEPSQNTRNSQTSYSSYKLLERFRFRKKNFDRAESSSTKGGSEHTSESRRNSEEYFPADDEWGLSNENENNVRKSDVSDDFQNSEDPEKSSKIESVLVSKIGSPNICEDEAGISKSKKRRVQFSLQNEYIHIPRLGAENVTQSRNNSTGWSWRFWRRPESHRLNRNRASATPSQSCFSRLILSPIRYFRR